MLAVLFAANSFAQTNGTFASDPGRRAVVVERTREQAQREKEDARQWARIHGLPMRYDDGRRLIELMAVRNGRPVYFSTRNSDAAISTGANLVLDTTPYNVDGAGLTVGVWDGGSVLTAHQEFGGRVANSNGVPSNYHATHVGGTIGATGMVANAKGMAPAARIDSYDWNADIAEMNDRAASYPGEPGKIYLSNHSYGTVGGWTWGLGGAEAYYWPYWFDWGPGEVDSQFGQYNIGAVNYDGVVYDAPYFLPFVSAGNDRSDNPANGETVVYGQIKGPNILWRTVTYDDSAHPKGDGGYKGGYDNVSGEASAKNIMTVGAVNDAVSGGLRSIGNASMLFFSSWGPADDGRIKPDIVANGWQLNSCYDDSNTAYNAISGTSMASPNACGSAALLVDYFDQRFPGDAMRASTLKGLIIHTADDLGNTGPDYSNGWGLMNTLAAADLIKEYADGNSLRMTEALLDSSTNQADSITVFNGGVEPLRITLCWTDPPGTAQSDHDIRTASLVHDLDLCVIGPGGTNYPYKLDYNNPTNQATSSSKNSADNVEQVYIETPVAGLYTIAVDYNGVLANGEQWYSLLISGTAFDSDADALPDYWEFEHFSNPTSALAGADSDVDGLDNLSELIAGTLPNDPDSVFEVSSFTFPPTGAVPFIVTWDSVEGHVYNVDWSDNLLFAPFTNISGDLPYPVNSYTDTVERSLQQNFYRIEVQLSQ